MKYKVTLNLPNHSKGQMVELEGIGHFENGKMYLIDNPEVLKYQKTEGIEVVETKDPKPENQSAEKSAEKRKES